MRVWESVWVKRMMDQGIRMNLVRQVFLANKVQGAKKIRIVWIVNKYLEAIIIILVRAEGGVLGDEILLLKLWLRAMNLQFLINMKLNVTYLL